MLQFGKSYGGLTLAVTWAQSTVGAFVRLVPATTRERPGGFSPLPWPEHQERGTLQMSAQAERPPQVFIWKEGDMPDLQYARELISLASPLAERSVSSGAISPIAFDVTGPWPADFWERVHADLAGAPAPVGTSWVDTSQYDLSGWQGVDSRTGNRVFVVTAYPRGESADFAERKPSPEFQPSTQNGPNPARSTIPFQGGSRTTDRDGLPVQQSSIVDKPRSHQSSASTPDLPGLPYRFSPFQTAPLVNVSPDFQPGTSPPAWALPHNDSFSRYYVGFGPRLAAQLIDLGFILMFPLVGLGIVFL